MKISYIVPTKTSLPYYLMYFNVTESIGLSLSLKVTGILVHMIRLTKNSGSYSVQTGKKKLKMNCCIESAFSQETTRHNGSERGLEIGQVCVHILLLP